MFDAFLCLTIILTRLKNDDYFFMTLLTGEGYVFFYHGQIIALTSVQLAGGPARVKHLNFACYDARGANAVRPLKGLTVL